MTYLESTPPFNIYKQITSVSLILLGLIIPFCFLGLGFQDYHSDEFYQALCCRDYKNAPLASLSFYIGHIWTLIFGDNLFALRVLAFLVYESAIAIGIIYLYRRSKNILFCSALFFVLSLSINFRLRTFDWDIITALFAMTTLLATLNYHKKPTIRNIICIGISVAAMALSRIPNIAVLPPLLFIIIYRQRKLSKILIDCSIGLCSFIFTVIILILIMYGNISDYIYAWNPNNIISGHTNLLVYFSRLSWTVPSCIAMSFPVILTIFFGYITARCMPHHKPIFIASLLLIVAASCTTFNYCPVNIHTYTYSVFFFVLFYGFLYNRTHQTRLLYDNSILCISAIFAIIPAIGSDIMALKLMAVPIIPIATAELYFHYREKSFPKHVFSLFALSVVIIFAILKSMSFKSKTETLPDYPELTYIRTSDSMVKFVNNLKTTCSDKYSIAYVGYDKYIYDYLLTNKTGYHLHLFHYDMDANDIKKDITDNLINYDIVRITLPENGNNAEYIRLYDKYLQECGYEKVEGNKLVYVKKGIPHNIILQ